MSNRLVATCYHLIKPFRILILLQSINVVFWAFLSWAGAKIIEQLGERIGAGSSVLNEKGLADLACYIVIIYITWGISYRIHDLLWCHIQPPLRARIIDHMLQRILHFDPLFQQQNNMGSLSNKLQQVSEAFVEVLEVVIDTFFRVFCIVLVALLAFWETDSYLALLFALWVAFFLLILAWFFPTVQSANSQLAKNRNGLIGQSLDLIRNYITIHLFATAKREERRFHRFSNETVLQEQKRDLYEASMYFIQSITFAFFVGAGFWIIIARLKYEPISIVGGALTKYLMLIELLASDLLPLSEEMQVFFDGWGYIKESTSLLCKPLQKDSQEYKQFLPVKGSIRYDNIHFSYPASETPLFEGVNLTIEGGSQVALVGYSGSGKTTLAKLIMGWYPLQKGKIWIDEQPIEQIDRTNLAASISFITQDVQLFNRSILDNIRYGSPQATPEEVILAAKKAYANDFIQALPNGYNSLIGEGGAKLSGGKKQRLSIARAFLKVALQQPVIFIMDEATSQLDPLSARYIEKGMEELLALSGATLLLITHRLSHKTLSGMDKIIVLQQGRIDQIGHHNELIKQSEGTYAQLWKEQNK